MRLILASASPRRKELIKKIDDLIVEVVPSLADERADATSPVEYAVELAALKAKDVFDKRGGVVLGADTVVAVEGKILGKPKNAEQALEMFRLLCGKTHAVITGICIISQELTIKDADVSLVTFADFDYDKVAQYVSTGSPFDKAGGYGIQDEQVQAMVTHIEGDIDNIVGLPVGKIEKLLKQFRR